jgi:hypothetical protein
VVDSDGVRWLYHGRTLHGAQFLAPQDRHQPITYYGPHSGVWDLMTDSAFNFSNIALIGLGTGTMATYTHRGQTLDIFELDPDVYTIAKEKFHFLKDSKASHRIFLGDARHSLRSITDRTYDLMIIDAFGGDTIPVHLLTKEVFGEYRSRLSDKGAILIHVSNRYVDLVPVLGHVARSAGANICYKVSVGSGKYYSSSNWIVITWDKDLFTKIVGRPSWVLLTAKDLSGRIWTDTYSSILPVMRWGFLLDSIRQFKGF